jgi:hypothetical protein
MRVEIYPNNEQKILEAAGKLNLSPTDTINRIIEALDIKIEFNVSKVEVVFKTEQKIVPKNPIDSTPKKKQKKPFNFVTSW